MSLIRNGNIVDDAWIRLGDETPAPVGVRAIVSLKRWREDRQSLLSALAGIGVLLRSNETAEDIADDLDIIEGQPAER